MSLKGVSMFIIGGNYGSGVCAGLAFLDRTSNGVAEQLRHSFAYAERRNEKNKMKPQTGMIAKSLKGLFKSLTRLAGPNACDPRGLLT